MGFCTLKNVIRSDKDTMKIKKIYEPIYHVHLEFIYGCKDEEMKEYYRAKNIAIDSFETKYLDGMYFKYDRTGKNGTIRIHVIWIEKNDGFYILSHELLHLVLSILEDIGIPINKENDECITYYHDFWLKKLWRLLSDNC